MADVDASEDEDLRAAEPSFTVKLASVVQGVTGLVVGLTGLQLTGNVVWFASWANQTKYALMGLGACAVVLAAQQYRARVWAGITSFVLGGILTIALGGWLLHSFPSMVSCLAFIAAFLSVGNAILCGLAIPDIRRTAAARSRLAGRGLDLGL